MAEGGVPVCVVSYPCGYSNDCQSNTGGQQDEACKLFSDGDPHRACPRVDQVSESLVRSLSKACWKHSQARVARLCRKRQRHEMEYAWRRKDCFKSRISVWPMSAADVVAEKVSRDWLESHTVRPGYLGRGADDGGLS